MKTYIGNIEVTKENQEQWKEKLKDTKKITGELRVDGSAQLTCPLLKEVGGDLCVDGSAQLPLLKEVGGDLCVDDSAQLTCPLLKEVGGYLRVYGSAQLPQNITHNPRPIFKVFKKSGYLLADNILSKIISKRKLGHIVFWKTRKIGSHKILYVAQKGNVFSHGETLAKASNDLRYKLIDRDTSRYKEWMLDSVHPIADIIGAYRAITGACEAGTKGFCEGKDIPAKMSVKQAIDKTKGAWGAEKFKEFFAKGIK